MGHETDAVTGEQEPAAWQWLVGDDTWTPCEPPSKDELKTMPHKFRPLYLGRMPAPACHGPQNTAEGDPSVRSDCAGAGTNSTEKMLRGFHIRINGGPKQFMPIKTTIYRDAAAAVPAIYGRSLPIDVEIWSEDLIPEYGPYHYRVRENEFGGLVVETLLKSGHQ